MKKGKASTVRVEDRKRMQLTIALEVRQFVIQGIGQLRERERGEEGDEETREGAPVKGQEKMAQTTSYDLLGRSVRSKQRRKFFLPWFCNGRCHFSAKNTPTRNDANKQ